LGGEIMNAMETDRVRRGEKAYGLADEAYGLIKQARAKLLEAVRADPMRDISLEPIWRALARVGGELGAVVDRIGDEVEAVQEKARAAK
jgi:hypothetical protein